MRKDNNGTINIKSLEVPNKSKNHFRYLGSIIHKEKHIEYGFRNKMAIV